MLTNKERIAPSLLTQLARGQWSLSLRELLKYTQLMHTEKTN